MTVVLIQYNQKSHLLTSIYILLFYQMFLSLAAAFIEVPFLHQHLQLFLWNQLQNSELFLWAFICLTESYSLKLWQQHTKQLEETMEKFALGDIKILICTNIVESGLDIQNANTIVVQDVQQFGLAQLYQVIILL